VAAVGAGTLATSTIATPAISQRAATRTLRFIPQADLANFDPIWTTQYVVRNASALVWDTLYGVDENLKPQRQMVEAEEVSSDGLTWTFQLRPSLKFHDGEKVLAKDVVASLKRWTVRDPMGQMIKAIEEEKVLAKDVVASLKRWTVRDPMGQMIKAIEEEITATDDRTVKWVLKKPYPKMLFALGKNSTPVAFVMPERIAMSDPFKQISEYVGSGPMRFVRSEWVPGAKAIFEKFADYVPRQEPGSWLAGGKRMQVDRIEWIVYPPFNDVRARRAILMAMSQDDYMRALVGDDKLWKPLPSFFTPGTALYTEEGGDILKGPRNLDAAKKFLAQSGYAGQPVTCLVAQDIAITKAQGDVTADLLKRLGMNVDFLAIDWGTVGARRAVKTPPGQGGWQMFHTWNAGSDCVNPAPYPNIRANGDMAWFGWPDVPEVEREVNWFDARSLDEEKAAIRRLNKAAMESVVFAPTGFFLTYQAWRKNITGVVKGPLPFF
jgi:peptide/nickel transport system substrate-binding protein